MKTQYFTFGQAHVHSIGGITFDKDTIVAITADNPREIMFNTFGPKWAMQYDGDELPDLDLFPRGIVELPGYEKGGDK